VKTINLGPDLKLPVDLASEACAFLGRRGGGKTYAAGKAAEGYLEAGVQIGIIDQVGKWWGLRLAADGKAPMNEELVILGGKKGDVPLAPESGALCAELFASSGRSMIFDVSIFSKTKRKQWCHQFGERLWELAKSEDDPPVRKIILEESHLVVPQMIQPDDRAMYGTWEEIIRLGRNHGFGVDLISQRPQSVNKEVLSQVEVVFAFQMNGETDRKAMQAWISEKGADKNLVAELPKLPKGDCFVWSPQLLERFDRVRFGEKATYDSTATKKVGQRATERPIKPIDLGDLTEQMTAVKEQAVKNDPKLLRQRVAELERALAQQQKPAAPEVRVERVEVPVPFLPRGLVEASAALSNAQQRFEAEWKKAQLDAGRAAAAPLRAVPSPRPHSVPHTHRSVERASRPVSVEDRSLPKGARDMLAALASTLLPQLSRNQVATLAGLKVSGGTFQKYLSVLRTGELVEDAGAGQLRITEAGLEAIGGRPPTPASTEELVSTWKAKLPGASRDLLDVLVRRYPKGMSREDLAQSVDPPLEPSGGTFQKYLSLLRTNGLVESNRGELVASESLFLSGAA
jgi:hypothetical protein